MNLEESLKLLEIYPPIIEVHIPENVCASRFSEVSDSIRNELKPHFPINTKVVVVNRNLPNFTLTKIPDDKFMEEFRRMWRECISSSCSIPVITEYKISDVEVEPVSFIQVHSVLKDGEELFKEKIREFERLLQEILKKDEPEIRDLPSL